MILRFRFSNFRSFREEQELSLVASSGGELPAAVMASPAVEEGVLRAAAIYGANASGKSNVLKALSFMIDAVRDSFRSWAPEGPIPYEPFALLPESRTMPSRFILDFVADGIRYQYGFSADAEAIHEEWLHAYPSGRRQEWFVREKGRPIQFSRKMPGENRVVEKNTRPNCLFLSAAAQHGHPILKTLHSQLHGSVRQYEPEGNETRRMMLQDPNVSAMLGALLGEADFGVAAVGLVEKDPGNPLRGLMGAQGWAYSFKHRVPGGLVTLNEQQQSDGTLAFVDVFGPMVRSLREDSALVVDELDRSLHPAIARMLVQVFNGPAAPSAAAQLIFNTHDTNLIDATLLRRDQIWFTEKDREGASHLYPLTDFHPRKSENVASGYLQGRYGAIPYLNTSAFSEAFGDHTGASHGQEKKSRRR